MIRHGRLPAGGIAVLFGFGALISATTPSSASPTDEQPAPSTAYTRAVYAQFKSGAETKKRMISGPWAGPQNAVEKASDRVSKYVDNTHGLGYFYDSANNHFVVRTPRSGPGSEMPPGKIPLDDVDASSAPSRGTQADFDAVEEQLVAQTWHPDAKHYGYGFHYNPELDKIDLTTNAPADVMAPLLQRFPDTLTYRTGRVRRATRQNDGPPHYGGAVLTEFGGGGWCTSGFTVIANQNARRYMVTAGHCYGFLQQVFGWNGQYWGNIRTRAEFPLWDAETIGKDQNNNGGSFGSSIYVGDVIGMAKSVGSAGSVTIGSQYCISGTIIGQMCSQQVIATNGILCVDMECTPGLIKMYHVPNGASDTSNGDSGAPVFNYYGSPSKASIKGLFIGMDDTYNYAEHWQGLANLWDLTIATG